MSNIIYFIGSLLFVFLFIALGKIVKLEQEVVKLKKTTEYLLRKRKK